MVMYLGVGGTSAAFSGYTFGAGFAIGSGPGGTSFADALTAGFVIQGYKLLNISASVDFSIFWGLQPDEACSIKGPFLALSMDPGVDLTVTMVWSIDWAKLNAVRQTGAIADVAAALGMPVGLTLSPSLLGPLGLPSAGVSFVGTWSWVPHSYNCEECNQQ
jgi:hypothetical protein